VCVCVYIYIYAHTNIVCVSVNVYIYFLAYFITTRIRTHRTPQQYFVSRCAALQEKHLIQMSYQKAKVLYN